MNVSQFAVHPTDAGCLGYSWVGAVMNGAAKAIADRSYLRRRVSMVLCVHAFTFQEVLESLARG